MKFGSILRILGVVALGIAALAAIVWLDRAPGGPVAGTPSPSPSTSVVPVSASAPTLSLGTVAVQTFSGPSLVRSGVGTVVASDGLIVTTAGGAPYGSGSYRYQLMTSSGRAAPARRVAYDGPSGLVLLKAETADLGTVRFIQDVAIKPGDELTAVGAAVVLSRYVPVMLPVTAAYVVDENRVALSLDRTYLSVLNGGRVIDPQGRTLGILRPGSPIGLVPGSAINAFLDRYFSSLPGR